MRSHCSVMPLRRNEHAQEQALEVKECADMVSQLKRVGKGFPVFEYDKHLLAKMKEEKAEA